MVAPLALWIAAFIVRAVVMMVMRRRMISPGQVAARLGWGWKLGFAAAVAWLLGSVVWLLIDALNAAP